MLCGRNARLLELVVTQTVRGVAPAGTTLGSTVEMLASACPVAMPIDSISPTLHRCSYDKACIFRGPLGDQLDRVARGHPAVWWWVSDRGLMVADPRPEALLYLSGFNQLAGKLVHQANLHGTLSKKDLVDIATELDVAGYLLKENLQPAQWRTIAVHNQKHSKQPIKTFQDATNYPFSAHFVRKRLYVARDAYKEGFREFF